MLMQLISDHVLPCVPHMTSNQKAEFRALLHRQMTYSQHFKQVAMQIYATTTLDQFGSIFKDLERLTESNEQNARVTLALLQAIAPLGEREALIRAEFERLAQDLQRCRWCATLAGYCIMAEQLRLEQQ